MEAVTRQWQNISDDDASFWRQRSREYVVCKTSHQWRDFQSDPIFWPQN